MTVIYEKFHMLQIGSFTLFRDSIYISNLFYYIPAGRGYPLYCGLPYTVGEMRRFDNINYNTHYEELSYALSHLWNAHYDYV